jgi:hypothetical protein
MLREEDNPALGTQAPERAHSTEAEDNELVSKVREDAKMEQLSNAEIYRNSISTETDSDRKRPKHAC